jgi:RimJ/RimL family protein N-acetyltransferase
VKRSASKGFDLKPDLQTARLRLTPLTGEHVGAVMAMDADPLVMRYIGNGQPVTPSAALAQSYLERWAVRRPQALGVWAIHELSDAAQTFLGWVSLKDLDGTEFIEVGYRLPQHAWGRGIATEAAARVIRYGFEHVGLPVIVGITHADNARSQAVLMKCGLTLRGRGDFYRQANLPFLAVTRAEFVAQSTLDTASTPPNPWQTSKPMPTQA